MKLEGGNPAPAVVGTQPLSGTVSYFGGQDPKAWKTRIPTYARVRSRDVYPGVDLVHYGRDGQLEYDFVVAPGADPRQIRLRIDGANGATLDRQGDLVLQTAVGEVRHHAPVAYQEIDGVRREVRSRFAIRAHPAEASASAARTPPATSVSFELAAYDLSHALVIDPTLTYSTYLGGTSNEIAFGLTADAAGAVYLTGRTNSLDFPTGPHPSGPIDPDVPSGAGGFVTKINAAGSAQDYTVFFPSRTEGYDVSVNSQGVAYVVGITENINFPTTPNAFQRGLVLAGRHPTDTFVAAIAPDGGSLQYATLLGGTGGDVGTGIAVDANDQACITGYTSSPTPGIPGDFPTHNAVQPELAAGPGGVDAFVTKFNADGSGLVFSTYLGGTGVEGTHLGIYLPRAGVDSSGNIYVAGITQSPDFPLLNAADTTFEGNPSGGGGSHEAFVAKYTPEGARVYATFLGGSDYEFGGPIAVDAVGNAYLTGNTHSTDFPLLNPLQPVYAGGGLGNQPAESGDLFVTKLDPAGRPIFSTYLGRSGPEMGIGIAVDGINGRILLVGKSFSEDFPRVAALPGDTPGVFLARLRAGGDGLLFSTFYAGNFSRGTYPFDIAAGPGGSLVACGYTDNDQDLPIAHALQPQSGGLSDVFLVRIDPSAPVVTLTSPAVDSTLLNPITIRADVTGDSNVSWQLLVDSSVNTTGTNTGTNAVNVQATLPAGPHTVTVRATDENGLVGSSSRSFTVALPAPRIDSVSPTAGTQGQQNLVVTLAGAHFVQGATVSFGSGITVDSAVVSDGPDAPGGRLTVTVDIDAHAAPGARSVTVTNPDGQEATKQDAVTVNAAPQGPALASFALSPRRSQSGKKMSLTLSLTGPAPVGGARVTFASSNRAVPPPPARTIPAGEKKLRNPYQWTVPRVTRQQAATITARFGGVSKSVNITIIPR